MWIFLIGGLVGVVLGVVITSLMVAASEGEDQMEQFWREHGGQTPSQSNFVIHGGKRSGKRMQQQAAIAAAKAMGKIVREEGRK